MIVYLSGNFPQLSKIEKERAFKEDLESRGYDYHRLGTAFYPKNLDVILQLKKEEFDVSGQSRATESAVSSEAGAGEERSCGANDSSRLLRLKRRNVQR
jgi:hypothetical protein